MMNSNWSKIYTFSLIIILFSIISCSGTRYMSTYRVKMQFLKNYDFEVTEVLYSDRVSFIAKAELTNRGRRPSLVGGYRINEDSVKDSEGDFFHDPYVQMQVYRGKNWFDVANYEPVKDNVPNFILAPRESITLMINLTRPFPFIHNVNRGEKVRIVIGHNIVSKPFILN